MNPATHTFNEDRGRTRFTKPQHKKIQNRQKWIPKKQIQAQSTTNAIWVPKGAKITPTQSQKVKPSTQREHKQPAWRNQRQNPSTIKYKWIPKKDVYRISSTQAWIPRQKDIKLWHQPHKPQTAEETRPDTAKESASVSSSKISIQKMIWRPKQAKVQSTKGSQPISSEYPQQKQHLMPISQQSIQQRALQLQIKLFGLTSVLLRKRDWLTFVRRNQGYKPISAVSRQTRASRPKG